MWTQLISQKKWNTSRIRLVNVQSDSCWRSEDNKEGGQGDQGVEETGWDKQHHQLGEQVIIISAKHHHLEEGEEVGKVGVGKDDHCQEGGEATMEDMRTRPKQLHRIKKGPNIIERLKLK